MKIYWKHGMELVKNLLLLWEWWNVSWKTNRRASSYRNSGCQGRKSMSPFWKRLFCTKTSSKLTEETPSPFMTDELRQKKEAAVKAAWIHQIWRCGNGRVFSW
jgi:hypothetical protein